MCRSCICKHSTRGRRDIWSRPLTIILYWWHTSPDRVKAHFLHRSLSPSPNARSQGSNADGSCPHSPRSLGNSSQSSASQAPCRKAPVLSTHATTEADRQEQGVGDLRNTDQTRSNEAEQRRIRLRGRIAPQHEEHPIRAAGTTLPTRARQERVHILPHLCLELRDLLGRKPPCPLAVERRRHLAVGQLADEDLHRIRKGGEDFGTHGEVILLPAFVVLINVIDACDQSPF